MPVGVAIAMTAKTFARTAWKVGACLLLGLLGARAHAQGASCAGPFAVAYRTLHFDDGREVSVWYPSAGAGAPAEAAAVSGCMRWPLVLFSHGLAGCGAQAVYITEEIARHGYVVVAPNHHDALCGKPVESRRWNPGSATQPPFLQPERWDARAHRDRLLDLQDALQRVEHDEDLGAHVDASRIGLLGHSLGGYTVLGVAGAWPDWKLPGVRAVVAVSPFTEPFLAHRRMSALRVPVMFQGGTLDFPITPYLRGSSGAYALSPSPKFLVVLEGATHLAWTNWLCGSSQETAACLANSPNAQRIDAYTIAFLDRYLKDRPAPLLAGKGEGLAEWQYAP